MKAWLLGFSIAIAGCHRDAPPKVAGAKASSTDPTAENYVSPQLPKGKALLRDAYGGLHAVEVEVATNSAARTRGMMWRTDLPDGMGMLFIFPEEGEQSFWMRNTLIPLDLIFISKSRKVVGIQPQATPRSLTSRSVGALALYVLEVPGGWADKQGITVGSEVEFQGISMLPVER